MYIRLTCAVKRADGESEVLGTILAYWMSNVIKAQRRTAITLMTVAVFGESNEVLVHAESQQSKSLDEHLFVYTVMPFNSEWQNVI